jgi:TPR repeat protein
MLLVLLLMGLGAAAWWAYGNYIGVERGSKPAGTVAPESDIKPEKASTSSVTTSPAASDAEMPGSASEERGYTAKLPVQPTALPDGAAKNDAVKTEVKPEPKPIPATIARADRIPAKTTARPAAKPSSPVARPSAENTGEADFRKGEAYLYGRGMPENCDAAVKSLKAASAKENAKARSAFGTMYATGHCVTRDLPTSYLWFAMALRVDPNNQILEKDLNAVWNQMTPPERQMAMRMKQ